MIRETCEHSPLDAESHNLIGYSDCGAAGACLDELHPIEEDKLGKDYYGREQLPVTILAHHGLVDGIHIARFYDNLEKQLRKLVQSIPVC